MSAIALPFPTFAPPGKRRSRAFGLLEVILVFAIVIGAAAVTFTVFQSVKPSADAAELGEKFNLMAANLRASPMGMSHDYTGLDTPTAVKAGGIPPSMIQDGIPQTAWGPITIMPWYLSNRQFDLHLDHIPDDVCAKLLASLASSGYDDLLVAGSGPEDMGGSVLTNGQLDPAQVAHWCSGQNTSDATVGIDVVGH